MIKQTEVACDGAVDEEISHAATVSVFTSAAGKTYALTPRP